jgi:catechol 2,3-dioxygenase-like lactoylglutathione lyase family enzyme
VSTAALPGLDHVGLTCTDLDAAIAFYHGLLAMPVLARGVGEGQAAGIPGARVAFARVSAGEGHMLELLQYLDDAPGSAAVPVHRAGGAHVALSVTDLDTLLARLQAHGVEPLTAGPVTARAAGGGKWDGARLVYVHDPDGHTVELVQFSPAPGEPAGDCRAADCRAADCPAAGGTAAWPDPLPGRQEA